MVSACIQQFCSSSGMKVNASKTRVFYSKNVGHNRRTELSNILGFQITPDLGKYLGVPLHHKRVTKESFQYIVDKVRGKLSGWKANTLSLAGRSTLVSSVTTAIPGYIMQTASLPVSICEKMEASNRRFVWGSSLEKRKSHLVDWDTVCTAKSHGGLGLKHLKLQNQAYMMKLGWKLVKNRNDLWVRVIRSKYKCGTDLMPEVNMSRTGSNVWLGIKAVWKHVKDGTDVDAMNHTARWKYDRHGMFSVQSAYSIIAKQHTANHHPWEKIWKLNTVQRCKTFMWLALHNKLLTNEVRCKRGMSNESVCSWCKSAHESLLHTLRDCRETKELWKKLVTGSAQRLFFSAALNDWLNRNVKNSGARQREGWSELFSTICWLLWKRRNERVFDKKNSTNDALIMRARSILSSINTAQRKMHGSNMAGVMVQDKTLPWVTPPPGWLKVNVDGAHSRELGAACGGVLRDDSGKFIEGFMFHLPDAKDSLQAELWGLLLGLKLAWEKGAKQLMVETDAAEVMELVQGEFMEEHPDVRLILEIRSFWNREWELSLVQIPRNSNKVADYLAKQALCSFPGYFPVKSPTDDLLALLVCEAGNHPWCPNNVM